MRLYLDLVTIVSADALLQMDERALIKHIIESYGQPKEHTKALNALHKKLEKDDKRTLHYEEWSHKFSSNR